jgi:hypothetical protein
MIKMSEFWMSMTSYKVQLRLYKRNLFKGHMRVDFKWRRQSFGTITVQGYSLELFEGFNSCRSFFKHRTFYDDWHIKQGKLNTAAQSLFKVKFDFCHRVNCLNAVTAINQFTVLGHKKFKERACLV